MTASLASIRARLAASCLGVLAAALSPVPATGSPAAALVSELGLEESAERADQQAGWRRPRKVLVRDGLGFPGIEWLQSAAPGVRLVLVKSVEEAVAQAEDAEALIGWCDPRILDAAPRIRWIQFPFAGVERCVSVPAVRDGDVLLTNMQRVQAPVIAEHAIAMMMALSRALDLAVARQPTREWREDVIAGSGRMRVLKGKTMLVAGLGGIGTEVARRAHALGMRVIATRARDRSGPDFVSYVGLPDELPKLAAEADVIVDALPFTPSTRGIFDARLFAAMKPTALFINVGRGGTVVTAALVQALQSGALGGAGLDVTDPEPLPPEHPLWQAPNIIITPHVSAESDLGSRKVWEVMRENLRRYAAGEKMLSVVDVTRGY
jgi:phosphoglycerate dehydrogenase-like enzyme